MGETGLNCQFEFADWDGDRQDDLIAIKKSGTGTGSTEPSVLSGASMWQDYLLATGTALEETGANWEFEIGAYMDLVGIRNL